ncbi:nucleoporin, WD repeat Nup146 [Schizosaccharomyces osmophilus]|uniref:Nucleoporin, WD repeat Nup146 n=1 Tax=Schizosaccharomyces osmophilus TaxID=2545709 RepID=A0AAE9WDB4_9SCHI|nr:nucleoporin, WD repeat Nup146 [Schizosaccharomyces osmophilus]WBW74261.1 nucleoporin, WD repeat Nup146 [Schizosaccharomyces osmophilus]
MNTENPFAALSPSPAPFAATAGYEEIEEVDTSKYLFSALKIGTTISLGQPMSSDPPAKSYLFSIHNSSGRFVAGVPNGLVLGSTSFLHKFLDEAPMNAGPQQLPLSSEVVHLTIPNANFSFVDFTSKGTCVVAYSLSSQEFIVFDTASCLLGNVNPRWKIQVPNLDFILPNPEDDDLIALHLTTLELCIFSISQSTIHSPIAREATTIAWSRRGKQCAVGFLNGSIVQYTPDGQAKKEIATPSGLQGFYVQDIAWVQNREFIVYYSPTSTLANSEPEHESVCYIISLGLDQSVSYKTATDPTPPFGADYRHDHHYFSFLQSWSPNIISLAIVSASSSSDIGLFAHLVDSNSWKSLVISEETKRASLPYSQEKEQDTSPLSLSLDLTSTERVQKPLSPAEFPADCPPLPILWIYDTDYQLSGFRFIYTDAITENSIYPEMVVAKNISGSETVRTSNNENVNSFASFSNPPKPGSQMSFGAFQTQNPAKTSAFGLNQGSPFEAANTAPKFGESSFSFKVNSAPANNAFSSNNSFSGFGTKPTSSAFSSFASTSTPANLSNVPKDNEASSIFGNAKGTDKQSSLFSSVPPEKAEPEEDMESDVESEKVESLANADADPSANEPGNSNINWGSGLFGNATQPSFSFGLSLDDKTPKENFSIFGNKPKTTTASSTTQASAKPFSFAPTDKSVFSSPYKPITPGYDELPRNESVTKESTEEKDLEKDIAAEVLEGNTSKGSPEKEETDKRPTEDTADKGPLQSDNKEFVEEDDKVPEKEETDKRPTEATADKGPLQSDNKEFVEEDDKVPEKEETDKRPTEATADKGPLQSDNKEFVKENDKVLEEEETDEKRAEPILDEGFTDYVKSEKATDVNETNLENDRQSPFIEELNDDADEVDSAIMPKESSSMTDSKLLDTEVDEGENPSGEVSNETNESEGWEKIEAIGNDYDEALTTKSEDNHEDVSQAPVMPEEKPTKAEMEREALTDEDIEKQPAGIPIKESKNLPFKTNNNESVINKEFKHEEVSENSFVNEAPKPLEKKPVLLQAPDLLEDMQEAVSTESNPMVNAFENVYLQFEAELDLVSRNMEKLIHYVNDQSNTGYSNDIYPNMTCLFDDTQVLESLLDKVSLWTSGKSEYDRKLDALRVTLVRLNAKRVQIQRLIYAHTDPVFVNRLKLRQLGPEALRRQKELRVSMEKVQRLMTSAENMAYDVRLSDVQSRKRLSLASIEVACSRIATVLSQRERELFKLEAEVKGLSSSSGKGPFMMNDLSSSLTSSLEKGSDSLVELREGSRSLAKPETQRQDDFCDLIFNNDQYQVF